MRKSNQITMEDEGSGYLISVSDIMAGLLFVFIITLVAFVIQFQDASDKTKIVNEELKEQKENITEQLDDLQNTREIRKLLLETIKNELEKFNLRINIDEERGVLHLTEKFISFKSNKADLNEQSKRNISVIAIALKKILPCYSNNPELSTSYCEKKTRNKLEAVFIEGHTDNVPLDKKSREAGRTNWDLSAKRAINTYTYLIGKQPILSELKNTINEPLFSVTGYAEKRPLIYHELPTDDKRNRRIDVRFIMTPPTKKAELIRSLNKEGIQ